MIFEERPEGFEVDIQVCATFVVVDGKFLLLHRHPAKSSGGTWGLPAGKVDRGESIEEAVSRELYEESGIQGIPELVQSVYVTEAPSGGILYHQHRLDLDTRPQVVLADDEHVDFKWVTKEEALEMPLVHDLDLCIKQYLL